MALSNDWQRIMLEEYDKGASDVEVCRSLAITYKQFDKYYKTDGAFQEVVDFGRGNSKAWWYSQHRTNLQNKLFQSSLYISVMKNRYGWSDKTENVNKDGKGIEEYSEDEIQAELIERLPGIVGILQAKATDIDVRDMLTRQEKAK